MSTNAYYVALEVTDVWHVSDDELLRPRCGDDMIPNLRVPVISPEDFRGRYRVCGECDPLAQTAEQPAGSANCAMGTLVQTRLDVVVEEAA